MRDDNGLNLAEIDPSKHPKYSPNLYRWLSMRGKKYRAKTSRVYRNEDGTLFIGMIDDGLLIGSRLKAVLSYGSRSQSFAFVGNLTLEEVHDFWPLYVSGGRCAIDTEHKASFIGDSSRWLREGEKRSCQWCGNHRQVLKTWTIQTECSKWVSDTGDKT